MKFSKIVLALLLILALAAMLFACGPAEDVTPGGDTPPDVTPPGGTPPDGTTPGDGGNPEDPGTPVDPDADDHIPGNITYEIINSTTAAIKGHTGNLTGVLEIPATYTQGGKTYTVVRIEAEAFAGQEDIEAVVIPAEITKIGQGAFRDCTGITELTLPFVGGGASNNAYIGHIFGASTFAENATYVPAGLAKVTLTDTCTAIPDFAFDACSALATVHIGSSVEKIGAYAFHGCALAEIAVPASVKEMGQGAFGNCPMTKITLPFIGSDPTAEIGYLGYLFGASSYQDNSRFVPASLTEVILSEGCTTIGTGAFYGCGQIADPTLPDSIISIGGDAFTGTAYYEAKPDGIVYVGNVLYACKGELTGTDIVVKEGTVAIATKAFSGKGITSITIPQSVVAIGRGAFAGSKLQTINLSFVGESATSPNNHFGYIFGAASAADNAAAIPATLKTVTLNAACTTIGPRAFYGCTSLTGITLGTGVSNVAKDAFFACTQLATITVQNGNNAFQTNGGLLYNKAGNELFAVPGAIKGAITLLQVTEIADGMFSGCTGITAVTLPNSVVSIGKEAFRGATGIASFTFSSNLSRVGYAAFEDTKWYDDQANGLVYAGNVAYKCKGDVTEITLKNSTLGIAAGAFENSGVTVVTMPNSVVYVGEKAFAGANALREIVLPFVGASATDETTAFFGYFFGAPAANKTADYVPATLTKVTLTDTCTRLATGAFTGCVGVTELSLPNSITSVAPGCLQDTAWFKSQAPGVVYVGRIAYAFVNHEKSYNELKTEIDKTPDGQTKPVNVYDVILRPDTVAINDSAFRDNTNLHSIRIPDSVTYIGAYAFSSCKNLESVRMPSALETLGKQAFASTGIKSIYIPSTIGALEEGVFSSCSALKEVYFDGLITKIGNGAFGKCTRITNVYCTFGLTEWDNLGMEADSANLTTIFNSTRVMVSGGYPVENEPFEVPAE